MGTTPQRVNKLRARFLQKGIKVTNEWLNGCCDYFLSEIPGITDDVLHKEAYEQWLLADLASNVSLPCFPAAINENPGIHTVNGKFAVQMQFLIDISESPYDQWRNMYNKVLDEAEDERNETTQRPTTKKKRVLKLELTDGQSTVTAMEYEPIRSLNTKLPPGSKILILGPIQCSKKVLLLKECNVQVLGGEVDDLLVPNAYENILLKAMKKPINPNPKMDYDEDNQTQRTTQVNPIFSSTLTYLASPAPTRPVSQETTIPTISTLNGSPNGVTVRVGSQQSQTSQNSTHSTHTPPQRVGQSVPSRSNFDNDQIFMDYESHELPPGVVPTNQGVFDVEEFDEFDEMVYEGNRPVLAPATVQFDLKEYKYKLEGCNLLTFDQLFEVPRDRWHGNTFIFLPETREVTEKLKLENNAWTLGVKLGDRSVNKLEVNYSPELLEALIGYSASEVKLMKQRAKQQPALKYEILSILEKFNETLQDNSKLWKIRFENGKMPLVVCKTELKPFYKRVLVNKIDAEKLEHLQWRI